MRAAELTFQLSDGARAAEHVGELQALHAEVCADPPHRRTSDFKRSLAYLTPA